MKEDHSFIHCFLLDIKDAKIKKKQALPLKSSQGHGGGFEEIVLLRLSKLYTQMEADSGGWGMGGPGFGVGRGQGSGLGFEEYDREYES